MKLQDFINNYTQEIRNIENNDFLHDFRAFLIYVVENSIKLTPKLRMIPRKHIYAINSLFKHPHPMVEKIGKISYPIREEREFRYFYFIDLLSTASGCVHVSSRGYLRKGDNFTKFFDANGLTQISQLFITWHFILPWEGWLWGGNKFPERLQAKMRKIAHYLRMVKDREKIDFKEFVANLVDYTGVKWLSIVDDNELRMASSGIKQLLITPMQYFGAVEVFTEKDKWELEKLLSFKFTNPLGKYLINLLTFREYDPKLN